MTTPSTPSAHNRPSLFSPLPRRSGSRRAPLVASVLAVAAVAPTVQAGNFYWNGGSAGGQTWNATTGGSNWSSTLGVVTDPGVPGVNDDAIFVYSPTSNVAGITLGTNFSIKGLQFNSSATTPVVIGAGNLLTIGTDGIVVAAGSASHELDVNVAVNGAQSWANTALSATTFTVGGVISGNSALTLQGSGSVLSPSGSFVFTNANTYSGALTLLNDFTALTLSGAGTLSAASSITLGGGTALTLDNTASAVSRLGSALPVTSKGGTINLIGNAGATSDSIGTLTLNTGATIIKASGATTTFTINGLSRLVGSSVDFNPTGGATIAQTGITNQAGTILAGYAVFGTATGAYVASDTASINWATVSGSNIVALGSYGATLASGVNTQLVNATVSVASTPLHTNSLYLAGTGSAVNASSITFATGTNTLIVDSGGIISSGGTDTYAFNGQSYTITHANSIGNNNFNGGSGSGGTQSVTGNITSGTSDLSFFTANGSSLRVGSIITNNGTSVVGVTKNGNGILDFSEGNNQTKVSNTFSGKTVINGGILFINAEGQLGTNPGAFVADQLTLNGGELRSSAAVSFNVNRGITVGPQGGTISYAGGGNLTVTNPITGPGGISFGAIAGGTSNSDQVTLSPTSSTSWSYQGPTTILSNNASYVILGTTNALPSTTALTVTHGTAPGNGDTKANDFTLRGHNLTVGSLAGEGNLSNDGGTSAVLTVGTNNLSTTYTGVLGGTGAANGVTQTPNMSLTKTGTGALTLGSLIGNTYSLGTTISNGAIIVTNTSGSGTGPGAVAVNGTSTGSGVLGGSGMVTGLVTVNNFGIVAPTPVGLGAATLQLKGGLTVNTGGGFGFDLATPNLAGPGLVGSPTSDNIFVTGTASLNGSITINLTDNGIPASVALGSPATYQLITDSVATPTLTGVTFHVNGPLQYIYSVTSDVANNSLDLTVSINPNPSLAWLGAPGNGTWNTVSTNKPWIPTGGGTAPYVDGANLTFGNAPSGPSVITLNTSVNPGSMTFANNTSNNYTISGSGSITGASGFTTTNTGSVTFNTVNTANGTANIQNGSVIVGATGALANSSYAISGGTSLTVNGQLTGTPVIANSGTFTLGAGGSVPSSTTVTNANSGAANFNENATIAGLSGPATSSLSIGASKTLALNGAGTTTFDGLIGGAGHLTVGTGTNLTLSNGANSYGNTAINGTLVVTNVTGSATGTGNVHVTSGGVLDGTGAASGAITVDSGGTLQGTGSFGVAGGVTMNGTLSPAGSGTMGTITVGNMVVGNGAIYTFDSDGTTSDLATSAGTMSFGGAGETVNVQAQTGFSVGQYTLALATGGLTNTVSSYTINATGPGANPIFTYNVTSDATHLFLNVALPIITWTGTFSNNWDFVDANWSTNPYNNNNQVSFTNSGLNTTINVNSATVAPAGGMLFSNSTVAYSLGGQGISGTGGLIMNGSSTVTLTANNTFTGATKINAGTVIIPTDGATAGAPAPLGAVPNAATANSIAFNPTGGGTLRTTATMTLSANRGIAVGSGTGATLSPDASTVLTYGGIVANAPAQAGVLNKSGNGELDLSGANTFSGGLNVNQGSVRLLTSGTAGGTGPIAVNSGAKLAIGVGIANPSISMTAVPSEITVRRRRSPAT